MQVNETENVTNEKTETAILLKDIMAINSALHLLQPSENVKKMSKKLCTRSKPLKTSKVCKPNVCPECKHTFAYHSNFKRHVTLKHPSLLSTLFPSTKPAHQCDVCQKYFKSKKTVQRHSRVYHKQSKIKHHNCPLCPLTLERKNFNEHFEKSHNLPLRAIKLSFASYEYFCEWKKAIERVTKSYFRKLYTQEKNGIKRHIFVCHRSGNYTSVVSEHKRKLKTQGSRKMGGYCPAAIKAAVTKEGKCEIIFQHRHVGHEHELQHLNLTQEERMYIADKLATNLSLSDVLDNIRNSTSKHGLSRLCLLTKKDIHNVRSRILKDKQLASEAKSNEKLANDLIDIHNKHDESEHITADISKIEKGWVLTSSQNDEIYLIKENLTSCDCPVICIYCKVCIDSYVCNCSDSSVKGNMCKHIHFFCTELNKKQDVFGGINSLDSSDDVKTDPCSSKQCDDLQINNIILPSETRNMPNINLVDSGKRNILKRKLSDLTVFIDSIKNKEEFTLFENTIDELTAKLKSNQVHSLDKLQSASVTKSDIVIPATNHLLLPVSISKRDNVVIPTTNQSVSVSKKDDITPSTNHILVPVLISKKDNVVIPATNHHLQSVPVSEKGNVVNRTINHILQSVPVSKKDNVITPSTSHILLPVLSKKDNIVIPATNHHLQSVPANEKDNVVNPATNHLLPFAPVSKKVNIVFPSTNHILQPVPVSKKDNVINSATNHILLPVNSVNNNILQSAPISKNIENQPNSKSQKPFNQPVLFQILTPLKQEAKACYIQFPENKNQILLVKKQ